jgi:hypothetical protein
MQPYCPTISWTPRGGFNNSHIYQWFDANPAEGNPGHCPGIPLAFFGWWVPETQISIYLTYLLIL